MKDEGNCVYKLYLEFWDTIRETIREAPANAEGLITVTSLSHWVQESVEEWSLSKPAPLTAF